MSGSYNDGVSAGYAVGFSEGKEEGYHEGYDDQCDATQVYTDSIVEELNHTYDSCGEIVKRLMLLLYRVNKFETEELKLHLERQIPDVRDKINLDTLFNNVTR